MKEGHPQNPVNPVNPVCFLLVLCHGSNDGLPTYLDVTGGLSGSPFLWRRVAPIVRWFVSPTARVWATRCDRALIFGSHRVDTLLHRTDPLHAKTEVLSHLHRMSRAHLAIGYVQD